MSKGNIMPIPPAPIRQPNIRFKLQVRYKNSEQDDVVYFSNRPVLDMTRSPDHGFFIIKNENEVFTCFSEEVFSFSITEIEE